MPGVIVYKNVLNEHEEILSFFKKSEKYTNNVYKMKPFQKWGNFGIMSEIDTCSVKIKTAIEPDPQKEKERQLQEKVYKNILDAYEIVKADYLSRYSKSEIWPKSYESVDLTKEFKNIKIAFLKYDKNNLLEEIKPLDRKKYIAAAYHTDVFQQNMSSKGAKLIFTVMMYLNDDYYGGEISFIDMASREALEYKPEAGDIVILPSCEPFYHGVLEFFNNDRYAVRVNYAIDVDENSDGFDEFQGHFNYLIQVGWNENGKIKKTAPEVLNYVQLITKPKILNINQMIELEYNE